MLGVVFCFHLLSCSEAPLELLLQLQKAGCHGFHRLGRGTRAHKGRTRGTLIQFSHRISLQGWEEGFLSWTSPPDRCSTNDSDGTWLYNYIHINGACRLPLDSQYRSQRQKEWSDYIATDTYLEKKGLENKAGFRLHGNFTTLRTCRPWSFRRPWLRNNAIDLETMPYICHTLRNVRENSWEQCCLLAHSGWVRSSLKHGLLIYVLNKSLIDF